MYLCVYNYYVHVHTLHYTFCINKKPSKFIMCLAVEILATGALKLVYIIIIMGHVYRFHQVYHSFIFTNVYNVTVLSCVYRYW